MVIIEGLVEFAKLMWRYLAHTFEIFFGWLF